MTRIQTRLALLTLAVAAAAPAQQIAPELFHELHWRNVGPYRGGRTRACTGVPSQPNVFNMGQVNGGVWKSDDYGRTWDPIFDSQPTGSIGAIQRPDLSVGNGIYKSTDAGR